MAITVSCPSCSAPYCKTEQYVGRETSCAKCGTVFTIQPSVHARRPVPPRPGKSPRPVPPFPSVDAPELFPSLINPTQQRTSQRTTPIRRRSKTPSIVWRFAGAGVLLTIIVIVLAVSMYSSGGGAGAIIPSDYDQGYREGVEYGKKTKPKIRLGTGASGYASDRSTVTGKSGDWNRATGRGLMTSGKDLRPLPVKLNSPISRPRPTGSEHENCTFALTNPHSIVSLHLKNERWRRRKLTRGRSAR